MCSSSEKSFVHAVFVWYAFHALCKQSSRWENVLDPLGCVLNYAFCNSIPIFSVETYFVEIFYTIEGVPKVNQKQQPSNTKSFKRWM
jgi:hypothetical protein